MTRKPSILVVDDEPNGRETLHALLTNENYDLVFAASGPEALKCASDNPPDLILLDVMMPGMDGFEVCQRIRADRHLAELPVILVTALDDRDSRVMGIEAGADDFVSKPIDRLELRARVRTVTRLNRFRRIIQERTKFEWVVEKANDGYVVLDCGRRVLYANHQARRFLGVLEFSEGLIGDDFVSVAQKAYRLEPADAWNEWLVVPEGRLSEKPHFLVRPETDSAAAEWIQVETMPLDASSNQAFVARLRDVTAQVHVHYNQWKFETHVRHKLTTPLGPLTNALDILQEPDSDLSDDEKNEWLSMAHRSAKRLEHDILGVFVSLRMRNERSADPQRCRIEEIEAVIRMAAKDLGLDRLQIRIAAQPEGSAIDARLSPETMDLVLREVLGNAKKFHPTGTPRIEVEIAGTPAGVCIRIADDGLTLSADDLDRVWVPYFQVEPHFTGQVPGMGIGLSTVAAVLWQVGGSCRMMNREDGHGVVVELLVPCAGGDVTVAG